ncbi:hypothetical protein [Streptomyces nogalater]|uniref:Uncharacterized protein n=1 Tax=Streptomyces nogalater TaxID=38314 RepID=A0ABW0WWL1_STRNO
MSTQQNPASAIEETKERLATLFVQLCGNPDDHAIAQGADDALHQLDSLLAGAHSDAS